jgi:hypothetical protein
MVRSGNQKSPPVFIDSTGRFAIRLIPRKNEMNSGIWTTGMMSDCKVEKQVREILNLFNRSDFFHPGVQLY